MSKSRSQSRLVYSTDKGRLCPACHQPRENCICKGVEQEVPDTDGFVRLRRETKGRGGKAVTTISGVPLAGEELKALARALKQRCGVGGSLKGATIEIQGDQRQLLKEELERRGFRVKLSGG